MNLDGIKIMFIEQIWSELKIKLQNDSFTPEDFNEETRQFLISFLSGENRKFRRDELYNAKVQFREGEQKHIAFLDCTDGLYRLDFVENAGKWQLLFIECITIPIEKIESLPFNNFPPLNDNDENWIREERRISLIIHWYNYIKNTSGIDEALKHFRYGAGEVLAAKAWIPYFSDKKSFIVYIAWWDNRICGEKVSIEKFSDDECIIKYIEPIWFKMYNVTGHLKFQIPFDEYKNLYEYIWQDRAKCSSWNIEFIYETNNIILRFYNCEEA